MPISLKLGLSEGNRVNFIERVNEVVVVSDSSEKIFTMSEEDVKAAMSKGWSMEYIEQMMEIWNSASDPTFIVHPELPFTDRRELFNEVFP